MHLALYQVIKQKEVAKSYREIQKALGLYISWAEVSYLNICTLELMGLLMQWRF